jgi:hypothetical protein
MLNLVRPICRPVLAELCQVYDLHWGYGNAHRLSIRTCVHSGIWAALRVQGRGSREMGGPRQFVVPAYRPDVFVCTRSFR